MCTTVGNCCAFLALHPRFSFHFFIFVVDIFRAFQFWQIYSLFHQGNFTKAPVVLVTSEHLETGQEYDAALIWTEDVTSSSFQVCLRELQNFDGKHDDISVVCVRSKTIGIFIALKRKERTGDREYFMESAGVRYLHTSCFCIRNRTSEISDTKTTSG